MIVLSATLSLQTQAQNCDEIVRTCDELVKKQGALIDSLGQKYHREIEKNMRLIEETAMAEARVQQYKQDRITYGAIGVAAGILVTAMVINNGKR
jgi:cytoplasmic iron level regulating protein YaaA (DUF328/UPF0246 family)